VLYIFKEYSTVPMSTTWVFLGLLAGRELGIRVMAHFLEKNAADPDGRRSIPGALKLIGLDAGKAAIGLGVSIALAYLINLLR
ncbi:MAG: hypothetical protein V2I43_11365, partial [Parvularcula sp.]|jgi:hypothetical protein|nr:hypothetical protein [Parvularcula sp.]